MIVSSFLSQYGLRIQTKEFETVSWDEFKALVAGLSPNTVLGRVVAIRSEKDPKIIKQFSPEQKRLHEEWKQKQSEGMTRNEFDRAMENLERMFAAMCG